MIIGIIGLVILYSPFGSPSLYNTQSETLYVQNPGVTSINSNMSNLPKVSNYTPSYNESEISEPLINEPIAQLPSSNFSSSNIEMNSSSHGGNFNSYTQSSIKPEEHSLNSSTYSVMPVMSFGSKSKNESQSQGQFTPMGSTVSVSSELEQKDAEIYANGPQKCDNNPTDCGRNVWHDGYWTYTKHGHKIWHDGYWEWVSEDCPGVPVGDGTVTIIVLLIGYSIFKIYKNEKNKQVLGTK